MPTVPAPRRATRSLDSKARWLKNAVQGAVRTAMATGLTSGAATCAAGSKRSLHVAQDAFVLAGEAKESINYFLSGLGRFVGNRPRRGGYSCLIWSGWTLTALCDCDTVGDIAYRGRAKEARTAVAISGWQAMVEPDSSGERRQANLPRCRRHRRRHRPINRTSTQWGTGRLARKWHADPASLLGFCKNGIGSTIRKNSAGLPLKRQAAA